MPAGAGLDRLVLQAAGFPEASCAARAGVKQRAALVPMVKSMNSNMKSTSRQAFLRHAASAGRKIRFEWAADGVEPREAFRQSITPLDSLPRSAAF